MLEEASKEKRIIRTCVYLFSFEKNNADTSAVIDSNT